MRLYSAEKQVKLSDIPKPLQKFVNYTFKSSSENTEDFLEFSNHYKDMVVSKLPVGYSISKWTIGHYYLSAVLEGPDKLVNMIIKDVRFDKLAWATSILLREMKNKKDFTGGSNYYTDINRLTEAIEKVNY